MDDINLLMQLVNGLPDNNILALVGTLVTAGTLFYYKKHKQLTRSFNNIEKRLDRITTELQLCHEQKQAMNKEIIKLKQQINATLEIIKKK